MKVGRYLESMMQDDDNDNSPTTPTTKTSHPKRGIFSKRETEIIQRATAHLDDSAVRAEVLGALDRNPEAVEAELIVQAGRFNAQQLRDKFRPLRRGKK